VAHAEIYSKERLFRFGLADNNLCDFCGAVETITHKLFECTRVVNLWTEIRRISDVDQNNAVDAIDTIHWCMGANLNINLPALTLRAELITILLGNLVGAPEPANYVRNMLKNLIRKEGNRKVKTELREIYCANYELD